MKMIDDSQYFIKSMKRAISSDKNFNISHHDHKEPLKHDRAVARPPRINLQSMLLLVAQRNTEFNFLKLTCRFLNIYERRRKKKKPLKKKSARINTRACGKVARKERV